MLGTVKNAIVVWIGIIFLQELVTKMQVSCSCCYCSSYDVSTPDACSKQYQCVYILGCSQSISAAPAGFPDHHHTLVCGLVFLPRRIWQQLQTLIHCMHLWQLIQLWPCPCRACPVLQGFACAFTLTGFCLYMNARMHAHVELDLMLGLSCRALDML